MARIPTYHYTDDLTGKNVPESKVVSVRITFNDGRKQPIREFDTHEENVKEMLRKAGTNARKKDKPGRKDNAETDNPENNESGVQVEA